MSWNMLERREWMGRYPKGCKAKIEWIAQLSRFKTLNAKSTKQTNVFTEISMPTKNRLNQRMETHNIEHREKCDTHTKRERESEFICETETETMKDRKKFNKGSTKQGKIVVFLQFYTDENILCPMKYGSARVEIVVFLFCILIFLHIHSHRYQTLVNHWTYLLCIPFLCRLQAGLHTKKCRGKIGLNCSSVEFSFRMSNSPCLRSKI